MKGSFPGDTNPEKSPKWLWGSTPSALGMQGKSSARFGVAANMALAISIDFSQPSGSSFME